MIRVFLVAVLFACGGSQSKPAPAPPPPSADAAPAQSAAGSGRASVEMPAECQVYMAALDKLAACPKMPADSKDAMAKAIERLKAQLPDAVASSPESRDAVVNACKQGADAVAQAAKSAGC